MNIPKSAIEPFGVIGIPSISMVRNIHQRLAELFEEVDNEGSSVYDACKEFENLIEDNIGRLNIDSIIIESTNHITDSHGALIGRKYTLRYRLHNIPGRYSQEFIFGWNIDVKSLPTSRKT
jgi:hypothetical protein